MDNKQRQLKLSPTQRLTAMAVFSAAVHETNQHLLGLRACTSIFTYNGLLTLEMAIKRRRRCMQLFNQANRGFVV